MPSFQKGLWIRGNWDINCSSYLAWRVLEGDVSEDDVYKYLDGSGLVVGTALLACSTEIPVAENTMTSWSCSKSWHMKHHIVGP